MQSPQARRRPRIMGILNLTPDSFSDGGRYTQQDIALEHALEMVAQGADIIDIGGESTRPGSLPVGAHEQIQRVVPTLRRLRGELDRQHSAVVISIDTTLGEVAAAALDAGAAMLNDVAAGGDVRGGVPMLELAAQRRVPIVLMHMQGQPATMQVEPQYHDVVGQVHAYLLARATAAQQAGVAAEHILLDPGIGFGKNKEHNLDLLAHLDHFVATGYPILLGTSRKRFMGSICQVLDSASAQPRPPAPDELVGATCATTALGVAAGVAVFRVHDVRENRQAADVAFAIDARRARL